MNRIELNDGQDFLVWREGSGDTIEVFDIAVNSERRKGTGRRLMEALFRKVGPGKRVFAITRATNLIAQLFYERLRFDGIPLRRFYSSDKDVDAVMYVRSSEGPV